MYTYYNVHVLTPIDLCVVKAYFCRNAHVCLVYTKGINTHICILYIV